jgi:ADP-heptose:LPS heptosyltransferase
MIERILINFPSSLGDTIMGLPVLDRLRANYPQARITAICSSSTKDFLCCNNFIQEVILFDKFWKGRQKMVFSFSLRGKYDLMVDLKNTIIPFIVGAKERTPFVRKFSKNLRAKDEYLNLIKKIAPREGNLKSNFILSEAERKKWEARSLRKAIFVACSSRERLKQYPYDYLRVVIRELAHRHHLAILGSAEEANFYNDILSMDGVTDLVGKTQMREVFFLLKNYALMLFCVDSSIMQLASYLDLPIVALFGLTDPKRYGPWSRDCVVLRKEGKIIPLSRKKNYAKLLDYMKIEPDRVIKATEEMLAKYANIIN